MKYYKLENRKTGEKFMRRFFDHHETHIKIIGIVDDFTSPMTKEQVLASVRKEIESNRQGGSNVNKRDKGEVQRGFA